MDSYSYKELLILSKELKKDIGLPVSRIRILLEEQNYLLSCLESADEINAERGMSAVCWGFSPYDIERVSAGREKKRLREIEAILYPIFNIPVKEPVTILEEEELPF